jgi:2-polyprenyl-6-hydroxyphenyl methylase/3-demethylubiquinone-9 3-methyltransferase
MTSYYARKLSGRRLERCYEVASPRVRQYLEAEIVHALSRLKPTDTVLELGCGYGRVARRLAEVAKRVVGIDTARESLDLARETVPHHNCEFLEMDALDLRFADGSFDAVACLQNGICAFGVDQGALLEEALRVTRKDGIVLLSSYADGFWEERLAWFEAQAAEGLLGAVDRAASRGGVIVCEDGFRAGRMTPEGFRELCARLGVEGDVTEVDGSSVVCEVRKPPV